jgi:hypothetical protein
VWSTFYYRPAHTAFMFYFMQAETAFLALRRYFQFLSFSSITGLNKHIATEKVATLQLLYTVYFYSYYFLLLQRSRPSPIALEPCVGNRAAVLSLIVRMPTGGKPYTPNGYTGIAIASSLVTLGTCSNLFIFVLSCITCITLYSRKPKKSQY